MNSPLIRKGIACFSIILVTFLFCLTSLSDDSISVRHLNQLDQRFAKIKDNSSAEEILMALSDAETVCRLVSVLNIIKEGGNDYQIGEFVSKLIDKQRWDVICRVLDNHLYYPQTTGWILMSLVQNNPKLDQMMHDYNKEIKNADRTIRKATKTLNENCAVKQNK